MVCCDVFRHGCGYDAYLFVFCQRRRGQSGLETLNRVKNWNVALSNDKQD